jgi:hypothetical protein
VIGCTRVHGLIGVVAISVFAPGCAAGGEGSSSTTPPIATTSVTATTGPTVISPTATLNVFEVGNVTVSQSFVGCCQPEEGSLGYVFVRDPSGYVVSTLTVETSYANGAQDLLDLALLAGPYELESFQRSCAGSCEGLDPPSDRCVFEFEVPPNQSLDLLIEFGDGRCSVAAAQQ